MKTLLSSLALAALSTPAIAGGLEWHSDALSNALGQANAANKPVLVYFWMDGSEYCTKFWQETLSQEGVQEKLANFVCYSADNGTNQGHALVKKFNVPTLPYVLFLDSDGTPQDAVGGYIDHDGFLYEVERVQRGENTLPDLQKRAEMADSGSDEGIETLWLLAGKLQDLGMTERHDEVLTAIKEADPKGRTQIAAQLHLNEVFSEIEKAAGGGEEKADGAYADGGGYGEPDYSDWDLKPAYTYVSKIENAEVKGTGYGQLAQIEAKRGDLKVAVKNYGKAEKLCKPERHALFCSNTADFFIGLEAELDNKTEKYVVKMAEKAVDLAEKNSAEKTIAVSKDGGDKGDGYSEEGSAEEKMARHMYTLARAYDRTGSREKAIKVAKNMLELVDNDQTRAFLAELEAEETAMGG